jgi:hypothetical protein
VLWLTSTDGSLDRSPRRILQSSPGVREHPESDDQFGTALASGDFNGDQYADLAVGADSDGSRKGDRLSGKEGAVTVLYGSSAGLRGDRRAQLFRGPLLRRYTSALFGHALVAGHVNSDQFSDLVVGAPFDRPRRGGEDDRVGSIKVFFGSRTGLRRVRTLRPPRPSSDQNFGMVLAVGDINGDRRLDLIEGEPGESDAYDESGRAGRTSYCLGSRIGPTRCRRLTTRGMLGPTSLAVGDVTGDGADDVVEGVPYDNYDDGEGRAGRGIIRIWRGSASGPMRRPIVLREGAGGVPDEPADFDLFGHAVDVGDIDGDAYADIVAGAPGEDPNGRVFVLHGAAGGVAARGHGVLEPYPDALPVFTDPFDGLRFGADLSLLEVDGDGHADLAVGGYGQDAPEGRIVMYAGDAQSFGPAATWEFDLRRFIPDNYGLFPDAGFGPSLGRPAGS